MLVLTNSKKQALLHKLLRKRDLSKSEIFDLLDEAFIQSNDVLLATFLVSLAIKKESVNDIFLTLQWLQKNMITIQDAPKNAIDVCGTGGSFYNTFNISTAASFVIAEAGVPVIKHGGRSSRRRVGSNDVLSALQVVLCKSPTDCDKAIKNINLAFLSSQCFNRTLAKFRFTRTKLGIPTILNIVAALANPADVKRRVMGVYRKNLVTTVANVLLKISNTEHSLVVFGKGIDEITTCGSTFVAEIKSNQIEYYKIEPQMFEIQTTHVHKIRGGNAQYNAKIIQDVLSGMRDPCSDIVVMNAGAGIYVGGIVNTLRDGVFMAKEILKSGKALEKLEQARVVCFD